MKDFNLHNDIDAGFKTPKGYFDTLEQDILLKVSKNKHGFSVPEGYFNTIEDKITKKAIHKPKVIPLFTKKRMLFAASIAALFILFLNLNNSNLNSNGEVLSNLDINTITNYIETEAVYGSDFTDLIIDDLDINTYANSSLSESVLEQYILDNTSAEDFFTD